MRVSENLILIYWRLGAPNLKISMRANNHVTRAIEFTVVQILFGLFEG